jgi:ATP synthase protein I
MPEPDESSRESLERLDKELQSFEAARTTKPLNLGLDGASGDGFRMLGQILGGVLGGLGLGWLVDRLAGTGPFGVLIGLLVGVCVSIYAAVRTAAAMSAKAEKTSPPSATTADDDD